MAMEGEVGGGNVLLRYSSSLVLACSTLLVECCQHLQCWLSRKIGIESSQSWKRGLPISRHILYPKGWPPPAWIRYVHKHMDLVGRNLSVCKHRAWSTFFGVLKYQLALGVVKVEFFLKKHRFPVNPSLALTNNGQTGRKAFSPLGGEKTSVS